MSAPGIAEWEGEGGALRLRSRDELPFGVEAIKITHYRVGPYIYTNLADALAQHRRVLSVGGSVPE